MRLFRRLAVLVTIADAVRRFAKNNPQQFARILDSAAGFVDKRTSGRYRKQIDGVTSKIKDVTGVGDSAPRG